MNQWLIVPEHHTAGMELIANVREEVVSESDVSGVPKENVAVGAATRGSSFYDTILRRSLAGSSSAATINAALEHVALWLPVAWAVLLVLVTLLTLAINGTSRFAVIAAVLLIGLFPLNAQFAPGVLSPIDPALVSCAIALFLSVPGQPTSRAGYVFVILFAVAAWALDHAMGALCVLGIVYQHVGYLWHRAAIRPSLRVVTAIGIVLLTAGVFVSVTYQVRAGFTTYSWLHALPGAADLRGRSGLARLTAFPLQFLALLGTCALPLLVAGFAVRARNHPAAVAIIPALGCVVLGFFHPLFFTLVPILSVPVIAACWKSSTSRCLGAFVALFFIIGVSPSVQQWVQWDNASLTSAEFRAMTERDLAHYLSKRYSSVETVILAPPETATALRLYAGFRVVASANPRDTAGIEAAAAIVSATTSDEAEALLAKRDVRLVVLPSWDRELDVLSSLAIKQSGDAFLHAIQRWAVPPFLRPISYVLPAPEGRDAPTVTMFEVQSDSEAADSAADFAEYFLDSHQTDLAAASAKLLQTFPTHPGAGIVLARIYRETGRMAEFDKLYKGLVQRFSGSYPPRVAWRQRLSLAVLSAQAGDMALSKAQTKLGLAEASPECLKSLNAEALFRLLSLSRYHDLSFPSEALREQAISLLPTELQAKINAAQAPKQ